MSAYTISFILWWLPAVLLRLAKADRVLALPPTSILAAAHHAAEDAAKEP